MSSRSRRTLRIGIALMAVLGTLMLGLERSEFVLPTLTLIAAVLSLYFTDRLGVIRLNRTVASVLALVAAAVSLRNFLHFDRSQQLLSIADLLIYLQFVLLFQQKTTRIYWQLITVSQLQVVVAAALSVTPLFGLLLGIHSAVALTTLLLFFVFRETNRWQAQLPHPGPTQAPSATSPRWSLRPAPMSWSPVTRPSVENGGVGGGRENWGAWRVGPSLALTTLVVSSITFVAIPRTGKQPWRTPIASAQRMVGFTPQVKLGQLGSVAENPETVLRIQFRDSKTHKPFKLSEPPLLRGVVMTRYEQGRSREEPSQWSSRLSLHSADARELDTPAEGAQYVLQDITLEPLNNRTVFCVFPVFALEANGMKYDASLQRLTRDESHKNKQAFFELATTGIRGRRQLELTADSELANDGISNYLNQLRILPWEPDSVDPFAGLKETAGRALADAGVSADDHYEVAKALERFLQSEGGFEYSLQPVERDRLLDPVEDFVVKNRRGHCEYFASALALMLRSQGIPSRVIIGFRGGEWNSVGMYYQVRQLHAHTWVEAYLTHAQLEKAGLARPGVHPYGGWLRLDGTADESLPEDPSGTLASVTDTLDYAKLLWTNYIVGMTRQKQEDHVYQPIASVFDAARDAARDAFSSGEPLLFVQIVSNGVLAWLHGNWFSWRGGLAAIVLCLALYSLFVLLRWITRLVNRWIARSRAIRYQRRGRVRFYDRLERLLRRHGIRRSKGQTPRELAGAAAGHLAETSRTAEVAPLPGQIVDAYYRVRFGAQPLDNRQLEAVEQSLTRLEAALARRRL